MTEPRRRKLQRRDESVRCWQGAFVPARHMARVQRRPGSPYGEGDWTVQLAIWRVGR